MPKTRRAVAAAVTERNDHVIRWLMFAGIIIGAYLALAI